MESLTVTELNENIKSAINSEFKNKNLNVSGEISNIKSSGPHTYLTLKDDKSSISVAFWGKRLDNKHGDHVEITGKIDHYTKSCNITFIGKDIKNVGIGAIHAKFEELKQKYEELGYFDNRKPLPEKVKNIGVITSYDGAALQDFLYVLSKNEFYGNVYIYDCVVQGSRCPDSVSAGIKFFNAPFYTGSLVESSDDSSENSSEDESSKNGDDSSEDPFEIIDESGINKSIDDANDINDTINDNVKSNINADDISQVEVDLIVITRGGGSFEDLMGFSNPKVVEAIFKSKKYTISAVGHEIDSMLSDYTANYRAPTPSIAGEVVSSISSSPKKRLIELEKDIMIMKQEFLNSLYKYRQDVSDIMSSIYDPYEELNDKLYTLEQEAKNYIQNFLQMYKTRFSQVLDFLNANNPDKMLKDGFTVFTDNQGDIVLDINQILNNKKIKLIHFTGNYTVQIKKCKN